MIRLTLNFAGKPIRKFDFDKESVCIGRDPDCEVPIDNLGVSRRHAMIEKADGGYLLRDLGSHNGTFVHGSPVDNHALQNGEEIFIGKYSVAFECVEPEPVAVLSGAGRTPGPLPDLTFRLDRNEIARIIDASSTEAAPRLTQLTPKSEGGSYKLEYPYYLIGRHPSATIRTRSRWVPALAALLVRDDKWFHVVSLSNLRPVRVNGSKIRDHLLAHGDVIRVGRYRYRFTSA